MKPSLQQQIEQAELAVIRRDARLLDQLSLASQLAGRAADRGRWVIGGVAAGLAGLALLGAARSRRHRAHDPMKAEPTQPARSSLWAAVPWLLPLLLPSRASAAPTPLWLRIGELAASAVTRSQSQRNARSRR